MKSLLFCATSLMLALRCSAATNTQALVFEPLPYAFDALEPHIDAKTMEIHYSRHHKAYYSNLLKAVEGTDLAGKPINTLLTSVGKGSDALRNNAGGHYNHTLFWKLLSPNGGGAPAGDLLKALNATFGSFDGFKEAFKKSALSRFGSGWAWLCVAKDGSLFITSTANQDNPLMDTAEKPGTPLLTIDVWEHAYYLKYQNLRASYIDAFWNVVNWQQVSKRFEEAKGTKQ